MDTNNESNNDSGRDSPLFFRNGRTSSAVPQKDKDGAGSISAEPSAANMQNRRLAKPYQNTQSSLSNNTNDDIFAGNSVLRNAGLWQRIKDKLLPKEPAGGSGRQKIMIILIPILAIIMIFVVRQVISKAPQKTQAAAGYDIPLPAVNGASGDQIDWHIPEPIQFAANDPIKPGVLRAQGVTDLPDSNNTDSLVVRGILYSDDKPSVVIGNRLFHLNDEINGTKVVEIDRNSVVFEKDGKKWTKKVAELELSQEQVQTELHDTNN